MPFLADVPDWKLPQRPTVVISPHPDDETLGAGGLLAAQASRKVPVKVVAVTDGEAAYQDVSNLGTIRIAEQQAAVEALGVSADQIVRLALPDSRVAEFEQNLAASIAGNIDAESLLVAPWPFDPHPDHEACGRAALQAAHLVGVPIVFYVFWAWHRNLPNSLAHQPLRKLEISQDVQTAKAKALACHRSQLEHLGGDPILPELFLWPAQRSFEIFIVNSHDRPCFDRFLRSQI